MRETAPGGRIAVGLVLLFALLAAGCALLKEWLTEDEWKRPRVVKVTGVTELHADPPSVTFGVRPGSPAGILARDGDLFECEGNCIFFYHESDGKSLVLDVRDDVVALNGKVVSLTLSEKSSGWEWLRKATPASLAGLRLLIVEGETEAFDFSLLEKVARHRRDIGLFVTPDIEPDIAARVISLFEPHFLAASLEVLSGRFSELEPRLANLETLWTIGEGSLQFLPRLPRLRALWLHGWLRAGSGDIPPGTRNLRSIAILQGKEVEDLAFLRNATGLRELVLWGIEGLKDISALAAFPDLKMLWFVGIDATSVSNLSVLDRLPNLAWLQFPRDTSQEAFARVIATHPDLEIIVLGSDYVRDLSPLQSLRDPRAVILAVKGDVDVTPLHQLKTLEYVGLSDDAFEGEAANKKEALDKKSDALEKALPDTFVGRAQPYCLGSGWILLLLPLIALLRALWPRVQEPGAEAHA